MKTLLKISLLAVALTVLTGCSAQRRAERHVRKAVELCPELAQVKSHLVDTALTVPSWSDCTVMRMPSMGETLYAPTRHGTFIVKARNADSLLLGFVAAPQELHYRDTISFTEVSLPATETGQTDDGGVWKWIFCFFFGITVGFVILFMIALKANIKE